MVKKTENLTPVEMPVEPLAVETPSAEPPLPLTPEEAQALEEKEERKRRGLIVVLLLLLLAVCCVSLLFLRYILQPKPLTELVLPAQVTSCTAPTYVSAFKGIDGPVGVAVSPDSQRIYVSESTGERLVKMFDRDGNLITTFSPPGVDKSNRQPLYLAVSPDGRVFVVDRTSNAIFIYDKDGKFIDAILAQEMTLSKVLKSQVSIAPTSLKVENYDGVNHLIHYSTVGGEVKSAIVPPTTKPWGPLGIRFDKSGNLIYTDITNGFNSVNIIQAQALLPAALVDFAPAITSFGRSGSGNGQFEFPQSAAMDSRGNFYVSDGNNSRVSAWSPELKYRSFFGVGSSESSLNLPRGMWISSRDCLLVTDSVGAVIRVYDVSKDEPVYAYSIGDLGMGEGELNFPNDVVIDATGRLYIADRENNRLDVWSY